MTYLATLFDSTADDTIRRAFRSSAAAPSYGWATEQVLEYLTAFDVTDEWGNAYQDDPDLDPQVRFSRAYDFFNNHAEFGTSGTVEIDVWRATGDGEAIAI